MRKDPCSPVDSLMGIHFQRAEETLKQAKSIDAQTEFDTEMEAMRNFHIVTPPREITPGILTLGNQIPPSISPTRPCAIAPPNNIKERFDYF
jgi:hypothetical protein